MPPAEAHPHDAELHEQVERKLIKVFGPERGAALLNGLLAELRLSSIVRTVLVTRVPL